MSYIACDGKISRAKKGFINEMSSCAMCTSTFYIHDVLKQMYFYRHYIYIDIF